ncbi:DUF6916 family protein [Ralstonia syzygii subsp. celebesensis]|uniref:DUF6916 domain-containing protein n=3 Tax=Ralstonia solanacearum species complex TaxID=3116862 RepID=A0AAD0S926_RALSL|nr:MULTISPECIES: hypothetical protein [Ralstonia solanacearum species complex]CCA80756.1 conserved hypothetical protein [blood disease bacterium R229]AQW30232.1 hypothetical protein B0B51_09760 [blood disease bacterium A2-HR MARDI]AXV82919.1 hypothetical protein CJO77_16035 [Ralstonia solanacearum]AXW54035.1 hypothetical protein CJO92_16040 [Ralstonia solanacearum]QQV55936.1 hypothetical protein JK151_02425 [Ralstonia syzygii subsp. celebesensis]
MTVSAELFLPHVGTAFSVRRQAGEAADPPFTLRLDEVATAKTAHAGHRAFSLFFVGDAAFLLPQGTYFLQHAALPEQPMFLVPIAGPRDGYRYQACFNLA